LEAECPEIKVHSMKRNRYLTLNISEVAVHQRFTLRHKFGQPLVNVVNLEKFLCVQHYNPLLKNAVYKVFQEY
jgi:hypothetical protein